MKTRTKLHELNIKSFVTNLKSKDQQKDIKGGWYSSSTIAESNIAC